MLEKTQIVTTDGVKANKLTPAQVEENMRLIEDLKFFLATAPANWQKNQIIRRYYLNHDEGFVSCVFWNNLYFITGTDIVRCIVYRFEQFGREIVDRKKFEEGVFSDLRSLKCGSDAVLEPSKSSFLDFLYKNSCLRTQKKQKVFFWFSVPHDKLFADALERDLKKEQLDQPATTRATQEPALSFKHDPSIALHDQLFAYVEERKVQLAGDEDFDAEALTPSGNEVGADTARDTADESSGNIPQAFVIKEEPGTGAAVVTPGRLEDDFPLDYFPQTTDEAVMIDPSVFMNPPDHFDDQLLIDQTYAKTPFYETAFEPGMRREGALDEDDLEGQYMVSVSQGVMPGVTYPGTSTQPAMIIGPNGYFYQQVAPGSQITNGQFYDSAEDEQFDYDDFAEMAHQVYTVPAQVYPQQGVYYSLQEPQYLVPQPPPAFYGAMDELDGGTHEQLERQQSMSPFARVFPSFQATAPPQQLAPSASSIQPPGTAKIVRFPRSAGMKQAPGRVVKPSLLRQQRSAANFRENSERAVHEVVKSNDDDTNKNNADTADEEEEYTTLPTPESTAPEHNPSHAGSIAHEGLMNDFLEEDAYEDK